MTSPRAPIGRALRRLWPALCREIERQGWTTPKRSGVRMTLLGGGGGGAACGSWNPELGEYTVIRATAEGGGGGATISSSMVCLDSPMVAKAGRVINDRPAEGRG